MAGTLQTRITLYTGTIADTTTMTDLINASIKSIINAIPESKIEKYASISTDSGSGLDISSIRFIRAHKGGYRARLIDAGLKTQVTPTGALSSVYIAVAGTGYAVNDVVTLSQGTSGTCTITGVTATVPTSIEILNAGSAFTQGLKTTTVAPTGGTGLVIYVVPSTGSIHEATTTDPVCYVEATKAYVIPSGGSVIGVGYPSGVTYSSTSISGFPSELEQAVILDVAIQELMYKTNVAYDSLVSLAMDAISAPTSPNAASFTYSTASYTNASYTDGTFVPASIDTTAATTIGSLPTSPVYTMPVCTLTTAPSDLTISSTVPTTPSAPVYSYSDAVLGTYTATTIGSFGSIPVYVKPSNSIAFSNTGTYIATSQDLEKAQTEISNQQAQIAFYNSNITNETNGFNSKVEEYRANIQKAIRQSELDQERLMMSANKTTDLSIQNQAQHLNALISEYKDSLQRYISSVDAYRENVNKEVTQYKSNLEKWTTDRQTQLALYSNDIQNSIASFNKELAIYNAGVQKLIEQSKLDQERLINQSTKVVELNKFNAAKAIETALQNNQQTAVVDIQNRSKAAEIDIVNKTKTLEASISQYQANLDLFQAQVGLYGQDINKASQKYSLGIQKIMGQIQSFNSIIEQCRKEFQLVMSLI